jgi:mRNA-degrading endonuclease toxin of MazEF toxin-antitoxin module
MNEIEINEINLSKQIKPQFGEVYKCAFYDETSGTEVRGPRPVVVISTKWYNEESDRATILPLTRLFNKLGQLKRVYAWEVKVRVDNKEGKVMTDQIHNIDKQRLKEKIGELSPEIMNEIMRQLRMLIDLFPNKIKPKL